MNTPCRLLLLAAAVLPLSACVDPYYPPAPGPVVVAPRPVYVQPRPVYVEPRPVYVTPRPVYVRPRPVYGAPRPVYRPGYGGRYYAPRRW